MKIKEGIKTFFTTPTGSAVANLAMAYVAMMLTRIAFFMVNWSCFAPYMTCGGTWNMFRGALVFDTSALLYVNALYLLLLLFPLHLKETLTYQKVLKWIYIVTNGIALITNLGDSVYFQYTGRRTTATFFSEFANETNIPSIIGEELLRHWYLTLIFIVMIALMWRLYLKPAIGVSRSRWRYYIDQSVSLLILAPLVIVGIRGSVAAGTRPITISNANEYVNRPIENALVLNTPFSIIRTMGKKVYETPDYMCDKQMVALFNPERYPSPVNPNSNKNVVIIILESMGKEYMGYFNHDLEGGRYKGYTPFLDSLASQSLTFKYSYANGRKSMDAMPSILSSIPMFVETFFLTPASLNEVGGIAKELSRDKYYSTYFSGGHNETLGFKAFTHATGYKSYSGLSEYEKSSKYNGYGDFDGKWAIWDEPFFQFFADNLEKFHSPFLATIFSATSHHPYKLPEAYKDVFPEEGGEEIHKCIRYTDMSLRKFFDRVKKQPWYSNTIFVIVADHTNETSHAEYKTDLGLFSIPIMFYTPDGSLKPQMREDVIAQQIDIMPTLLSYLGKKNPYVSFGTDLLTTPPEQTFAVNYNNGIYQYVKGDYVLQFDGSCPRAIYKYKTDRLMTNNLIGKVKEQAQMERELKAIIQQYMQRMNTNHLTVK